MTTGAAGDDVYGGGDSLGIAFLRRRLTATQTVAASKKLMELDPAVVRRKRLSCCSHGDDSAGKLPLPPLPCIYICPTLCHVYIYMPHLPMRAILTIFLSEVPNNRHGKF